MSNIGSLSLIYITEVHEMHVSLICYMIKLKFVEHWFLFIFVKISKLMQQFN